MEVIFIGNPYIYQTFVFGSGTQHYLVSIVVPNFAQLEEYLITHEQFGGSERQILLDNFKQKNEEKLCESLFLEQFFLKEMIESAKRAKVKQKPFS